MLKKICILSAALLFIVNLIGCSLFKADRNAINKLKYFPKNVDYNKPNINVKDTTFLLNIAKDTWKFFDNSVYDNTGLIVDKIFIDKQNAAHYTSITNVGLYLVSVIYANKLHLISTDAAKDKIKTTLNTLQKLERYNGFFYNWYEVDNLKQSNNYISTVDAAWLYLSLYVVGTVFKDDFGEICDKLINQANLMWLYDEKVGAFTLGYDTKTGHSIYHYKLLVSEARVALYLAVLKGELSKETWFKLNRALDLSVEQEQIPQGNFKNFNGINYFSGYYLYDTLKIVPSWGGSTFEYLMPDLFFDERIAAKGMGLNNYNMIKVQKDYCLNKKRYKTWGLSPCATVEGGYGEFGVYLIGTKKGGYLDDILSPHASCIAINYEPRDAIDNLKAFINYYPIYGEYGFYDCVDPKSGKVGKVYLALDQAMIFISIANYLTDNYIPKIFSNNKNINELYKVISEEEFY